MRKLLFIAAVTAAIAPGIIAGVSTDKQISNDRREAMINEAFISWCSRNGYRIDTLSARELDRIAEKLYNRVRPSDAEARYIKRRIKSQHMNPHALLFRGWWIDFTAITRTPEKQLNIFTNL